MPRARHAQGRPNTRVIPVDWNETHAPVVAKAARGACTIRVPGSTQTWNETRKQTEATPNPPYYEGPCRVQALKGQARVVYTVDDRTVLADYLITVPLNTPTSENHLVTLAETGDSTLDGLTVQIEWSVRGTERFERDLYCVLNR